jgi:hypothetical protein
MKYGRRKHISPHEESSLIIHAQNSSMQNSAEKIFHAIDENNMNDED